MKIGKNVGFVYSEKQRHTMHMLHATSDSRELVSYAGVAG